MQVIINETGKVGILKLVDPKTGVNYVADFIGNAGALGCEFKLIDGDYHVDQEDFDWWERVIAKQQEADNLKSEYTEEHGSEELYELLEQVSACDLEDMVNQELDLLKEAVNNQ